MFPLIDAFSFAFHKMRTFQLSRGVWMFEVGIQLGRSLWVLWESADVASSLCLISCPSAPVLVRGALGHFILHILHPGGEDTSVDAASETLVSLPQGLQPVLTS